MGYLSYAGFILTAIGTVITIWQANKARLSANLAKTYRDEVARDRCKMALIELYPQAKRIRGECRKIMKPFSEKPMRGIDPQKILENIQDFIEIFEETSCRLRVNEFDGNLTDLKSYVSLYRQEIDADVKYCHAENIYKEVNSIALKLAEQINIEI